MRIPRLHGWRLLWSIGKFLAIAYLTICLVLFFAQSRLVFVPDARNYKDLDALNLPHQEVWLPVSTQIVSSSFTSMQQLTAQDWKFRLFPIQLILNQKFDSIGKVRSLKMPTLFIHGLEDALIPVAIGKALYEAAPQPKQLLLIPKAGHNHREAEFDKPENLKTVQDFARQVIAASQSDN